jgi:anthranilate synthase component I
MKKTEIKTTFKKLLADVYTPVGIYLRLRDRFRDTILLESADSHAGENSFSIIGINAIAGIEIRTKEVIEFKLPGQKPEKIDIKNTADVPAHLWDFMQHFEAAPVPKPISMSQGLYGYATYDAVEFFDTIKLSTNGKRTTANEKQETVSIPLMRYRLYQYILIINHFKDELYICENETAGIESELTVVESLIKSRDVPTFPFALSGEETSNLTNGAYMDMVKKGIAACNRGDVFQIVLSRRFQQSFTGDEFNVYRALRSINPGPYLFYFDYGDYKLMGSSPESQLLINNGEAVVHPIAGTVKRTGNDEVDKEVYLKR